MATVIPLPADKGGCGFLVRNNIVDIPLRREVLGNRAIKYKLAQLLSQH